MIYTRIAFLVSSFTQKKERKECFFSIQISTA